MKKQFTLLILATAALLVVISCPILAATSACNGTAVQAVELVLLPGSVEQNAIAEPNIVVAGAQLDADMPNNENMVALNSTAVTSVANEAGSTNVGTHRISAQLNQMAAVRSNAQAAWATNPV